MFLKGTPALKEVGAYDFLFENVWKPTAETPSYGIGYIILTSLVGTIVDSSHQYTGGANMLSAIIVLAIMILPTVISVSTSSLKVVSDNLRAASLALGATKEQTIFRTVIPAAKSGILTGVVLGIGRALGEAMAINMVAGGAVNIPLPFKVDEFICLKCNKRFR